MGVTHALTGLVVGCPVAQLAGELAGVPMLVRIAMVLVTGGAALLPDIDHTSSTVTRSLWLLTGVLSLAAVGVSRLVYEVTRGPDDPDSGGGHRYFWHHPVGCLVFGVIVAGVTASHDIAAAVTVGLLIALLGEAYRPLSGLLGLVATFGLPLAVDSPSQWWWCWGLAVGLGALTHRAGDKCTVSGVPRASAMLVEHEGRRWGMVSIDRPWVTNSPTERRWSVLVFTPALALGVALLLGFVSVTLWPLSVELFPEL